jgi:hypothetical protein
LPVEAVVVPSLQVVGAGSSAHAGIDNAKAIKGAAIKPTSVVFFISALPIGLAEKSILIPFPSAAPLHRCGGAHPCVGLIMAPA